MPAIASARAVLASVLAIALGACAAAQVAATPPPTLVQTSQPSVVAAAVPAGTVVFCGTFQKYEHGASASVWELFSPAGVSLIRFRWNVSGQDRPDFGSYVCARIGPPAGQDAALGVISEFVSLVTRGDPDYLAQP